MASETEHENGAPGPQAQDEEPAVAQDPRNQQLVVYVPPEQLHLQATSTPSTPSSMLTLSAGVLGAIIARLFREINEPREVVCYHAHFSLDASHAWNPEARLWRRLPPFNFLPHDPHLVDPGDVTGGFRALAAHKGLVWVAYQGQLYVCNPLTREYTAVPSPVENSKLQPAVHMAGVIRVSDDPAAGFTLFAFCPGGTLLTLRSGEGRWGWGPDCGEVDGIVHADARRGPFMAGDVLYWWVQARRTEYVLELELMSYDTVAARGRPQRALKSHWEDVLYRVPEELYDADNLQAVPVGVAGHGQQVWVVRLVTYRARTYIGGTYVRVEVARLKLDGTGGREEVIGKPRAGVPAQVVDALEHPFPAHLLDPPRSSVFSASWIMAGAGSRIRMLAVSSDASASRELQLDVLTREWAVGRPCATPALFRECKARRVYSVVAGAFQLSRAPVSKLPETLVSVPVT